MPRTIPEYSRSSIYKLCCNNTDVTDIYIGSTTNFSNRKKCHKCSCTKLGNKKYENRVYQFIRTNGGWENWSMVEIEQYNANNKRHLETRERYWIESMK